jgi:hypothetical protein
MTIAREINALERLAVSELLRRYEDVFGEPVRSRNRRYLIRRIAWKLQADAEGGLSVRALGRAAELANPSDARVTPPRTKSATSAPPPVVNAARAPSDPRLPVAGAVITRRYKGRTLSVVVRSDGFEFDGERFGSLSAVAKAITGSHMNGYRFFGLEAKS